MKSILVKRLESSFYAFRKTLGRFIESHKKFIEMFKGGEVYVSKKVDVYDLLDNDDDYKLMQLVENNKVQYFKSEDFNATYLHHVEKDLNALERIYNLWAGVTSDPKIEEFIRELKEKPILQGNKKIILSTRG